MALSFMAIAQSNEGSQPAALQLSDNRARYWFWLATLYRYFGAAALGIIAVLARMALQPQVGLENPYTTFYFAVALSTWLFELGSGLLCFLVCAISAVIFLLDPILPLHIADRGEQINFALFTVSALGIWLIVVKLKSTQKQLRQTLEQLATSEQEARKANEAKDEFLAMISHELRTPLNSLMLSARLISQEGQTPTQNARGVMIINRAAQKLADMVEDLLDSARIATGRLALNRQFLDLVTVVQSAIDLMVPSAHDRGVDLVPRISIDRAVVNGDRNRLQECVLNLIGNSIKFTPRGGAVEIAIETGNDRLQLRVSDTGIGIDPIFLPRAFDRFAQGDRHSADRRGGLGLGLYIVRHVIELHDGTIAAFSAGKGHGATFTITLPLICDQDGA